MAMVDVLHFFRTRMNQSDGNQSHVNHCCNSSAKSTCRPLNPARASVRLAVTRTSADDVVVLVSLASLIIAEEHDDNDDDDEDNDDDDG